MLWALSVLFAATTAENCLATDPENNLYIFTSNAFYSAGNIESWSNKPWSVINKNGAPDFEGRNTQCFMAQYSSDIMVLNGDSKSKNKLFTFSVKSKQWNSVAFTGVDTENMYLTLDHDTVTFYGLNKGDMYFLKANEKNLVWEMERSSGFASDYNPVVGFGENRLYFINDHALKPGEAHVFVIHFGIFQVFYVFKTQPGLTAFDGPKFPQTTGKTVSFPKADNTVPMIFGFIPSDFSATYLINSDKTLNSTTKFPAPHVKDPNAIYTATTKHIIQLTSNPIQMWYLDVTNNKNNWVQIENQSLTEIKPTDHKEGT